MDSITRELFTKLFPGHILEMDVSATISQATVGRLGLSAGVGCTINTKYKGNVSVRILDGKAHVHYYMGKNMGWQHVEINLADPDSLERLRSVVEG